MIAVETRSKGGETRRLLKAGHMAKPGLIGQGRWQET